MTNISQLMRRYRLAASLLVATAVPSLAFSAEPPTAKSDAAKKNAKTTSLSERRNALIGEAVKEGWTKKEFVDEADKLNYFEVKGYVQARKDKNLTKQQAFNMKGDARKAYQKLARNWERIYAGRFFTEKTKKRAAQMAESVTVNAVNLNPVTASSDFPYVKQPKLVFVSADNTVKQPEEAEPNIKFVAVNNASPASVAPTSVFYRQRTGLNEWMKAHKHQNLRDKRKDLFSYVSSIEGATRTTFALAARKSGVFLKDAIEASRKIAPKYRKEFIKNNQNIAAWKYWAKSGGYEEELQGTYRERMIVERDENLSVPDLAFDPRNKKAIKEESLMEFIRTGARPAGIKNVDGYYHTVSRIFFSEATNDPTNYPKYDDGSRVSSADGLPQLLDGTEREHEKLLGEDYKTGSAARTPEGVYNQILFTASFYAKALEYVRRNEKDRELLNLPTLLNKTYLVRKGNRYEPVTVGEEQIVPAMWAGDVMYDRLENMQTATIAGYRVMPNHAGQPFSKYFSFSMASPEHRSEHEACAEKLRRANRKVCMPVYYDTPDYNKPIDEMVIEDIINVSAVANKGVDTLNLYNATRSSVTHTVSRKEIVTPARSQRYDTLSKKNFYKKPDYARKNRNMTYGR